MTSPLLLKDLTIRQAAAAHDTLVLVLIAVTAGAALLFPSLALLFRLVLGGRMDHGTDTSSSERPVATARRLVGASASGLAARGAGAALLVGFGMLTLADASSAHAVGVVALFAFIVLAFAAVEPAALAARDGPDARSPLPDTRS